MKKLYYVFLTVFLSVSMSVVNADTSEIKNIHTVQVAAFSSLKGTLEEMKRIRENLFEPFMLDVYDSKQRLWHTIHVGYYSEFSSAKDKADDYFEKTGKKALVFSKPRETLALFESRVTENDNRIFLDKKESKSILDQSKTKQDQEVVEVQDETRQVKGFNEDTNESKTELTEKLPIKHYISLSLGVSLINKHSKDLDSDLSRKGYAITSDIDRTNIGWKIVCGYKFNKNFGVEAGYLGFQDVDTNIITKVAGTGLVNEVVKHVPLTMRGTIVEGVYFWNINPKISIIGKAGGFLWSGEKNTVYKDTTVTRNDDGVDLVLGIGTELNLFDEKSLQFEYERLFTEDSVDFISVGVKAGF